MKKHTPLPWMPMRYFDSGLRQVGVQAMLGECDKVQVCHVGCIESDLIGTAEGDMEFIIRAANSHHALVDALERLLESIEKGGPYDISCTIARAVLAEAKGKYST